MSRVIVIGGGALLLGLLVLAVLGVRSCARDPEPQAAPVEKTRDAALVGVAAEGNAITADAMTNAADIAAITKENEDAIRSAPGGDARVSAASNGAALARLCKRASYANQPRCVAMQRSGAGATGR